MLFQPVPCACKTLKERNPSHQGISKWEKVGVGPSYVHSSPWIHAFTILALIVVLSCWYLVLAWLLHLELLQTIRYFRRTPDQPPVALPANGSHSLQIPGSANRRLPVPRRSAYLCPAPDQRSGPQATASRCALHPSSLVLLLASSKFTHRSSRGQAELAVSPMPSSQRSGLVSCMLVCTAQ